MLLQQDFYDIISVCIPGKSFVTFSDAESGRNVVASTRNEEWLKDKEDDEDRYEEERSWRDPSAHNFKWLVVCGYWLGLYDESNAGRSQF